MDIYNSAICVPVLFILRTVNWKKNYMHDNYFNMQLDFWLLHIKSTHAATQYICLIVFLIVQIFIICKTKKNPTTNKTFIKLHSISKIYQLKFSIWFVVSINFVEYYMYMRVSREGRRRIDPHHKKSNLFFDFIKFILYYMYSQI